MNDSGNETDDRFSSVRSPTILPQKPIIIGDPATEVIVPKGEPLILDFKVAAYPEARIQWYHNNFELKTGVVTVAPNHSRLSVENPAEGLYRATAINEHGDIVYETRVFTEIDPVNEKLIFTRKTMDRSPQPIYKLKRRGSFKEKSNLPKAPKIVTGFAPTHRIKVDEPLVLDVEAEAIPEASFLWRVNNFEIKPNKAVKIERVDENRSRIVFLQPVEGKYEVFAQNYLGQDSLNTKVIVDYAFGDDNKFPIFIDALPATTILAADTLEHVMVVVVRTSEPGTFRWFADGAELESDRAHEILSEPFKSTLIIRCVVMDNTEYAVEFTNSLGIIHSKTTVMTSPKHRPKSPLEKPPRFVELLSSTAIKQGDVLEARVTVGEDTSPCEFEWTLKGSPVDKKYVMSSDYESTIRIPDAKRDMSGLLYVQAKNNFGVAESSMHFMVVDGQGEKQVKIFQDTMTKVLEEPKGTIQTPEVPTEAEVSEIEIETPPVKPKSPSPEKESKVKILETEEDFSKTTNIKKREETYNLLVKVADTLAQSLAAKIVLDAMSDAAKYLTATSEIESEEEGGASLRISPAVTLAPTFEISKETYNVNSGDNVTIHTRILGAPCDLVEWYKEGVKVEENE